MIVDAHYHLEPRLETVERLLAQMRALRIDRVALIAPVSEPLHLGRVGRRYWEAMRRGLAGSAPRLGRLLYAGMVRPWGRVSFGERGFSIVDRPDNDAVERVVTAHPDRFVGWIVANPLAPGALDEVARRLARPGWIGVKAHPFWHRYAVACLDEVAALCQDRGRPLLVHLGTGGRGDFRRLPERFPRLKLVYAHAGIPWYAPLWAYARGREGIFVDLSSPYLTKALRLEALRVLGPSRCLYGSDGPYGFPAPGGSYDHSAILGQLERAGLGAAELEQVLGGNFAALTAG